MLRKLKRKYNRWVFKNYGFERGGFFENIPIIFKLCPLFSPSLYGYAEGEQYIKWFLEGLASYQKEEVINNDQTYG